MEKYVVFLVTIQELKTRLSPSFMGSARGSDLRIVLIDIAMMLINSDGFGVRNGEFSVGTKKHPAGVCGDLVIEAITR